MEQTQPKKIIPRLTLSQTDKEELLVGIKKNGMKYSVRKHRKAFFMPDIWKKLMIALGTPKSQFTAAFLVQTGARINELRFVEERDIDYDRNTLNLRVTKTKAKKKGEGRGKPRTILMNSHFIKELKKQFKGIPPGSKITILSTPAFNIALKKALKDIGKDDWYMYSAHSIRKTHGNWLNLMNSLGMMKCDATELCLRLGHDYNTFLSDYGSPAIMNMNDAMLIKEILGDLYERRV
jgi:integrase